MGGADDVGVVRQDRRQSLAHRTGGQGRIDEQDGGIGRECYRRGMGNTGGQVAFHGTILIKHDELDLAVAPLKFEHEKTVATPVLAPLPSSRTPLKK
jgi:hypothetical protein